MSLIGAIAASFFGGKAVDIASDFLGDVVSGGFTGGIASAVDGGADTASLFEGPGGVDPSDAPRPVLATDGGSMSLLGDIVGATRDVLVSRAGARTAASTALSRVPVGTVLGTGAGLAAGLIGRGGSPKRRRSRARITSRELNELFMLKTVFGARSPVLTLAGIKMLGRGG